LNKHLENIIALSEYDSKISSFGPKIDSEKAKIQIFIQNADEIKGQIEKTKREISEIQAKKIKNEVHLKELKHKIDENSKKMNSVSNEKEAKALQLEEEIAKDQISHINDEISRFESTIEGKQEVLKTLTAELEEEEKNALEIKEVVNTAIDELEVKRNELSEKRATIVESVDSKILSFYEKIKRWAGNTAVVEVKKQACYGCFMKINDKAYADVIKSESIITCPHCGRIIYKSTNEE
jgi:predicted  nucleic acid-binding Zn-ribbon protein